MEGVLVAKDVYILMKKEYRISRNIRAEWYLNRINSCIKIARKTNVNDFHGELEVVSVLPEDPPLEWDSDTAHEYEYFITEKTQLHFIARKYRLVFCLDLSPSLSAINTNTEQVTFEQSFSTLEKCLRSIVRPFYVPGSQLLFFPKIYLTIIAHTPFSKMRAQHVLVQGWLLMSEKENLEAFLKNINSKLGELQNKLAELSKDTCVKVSALKRDPERAIYDRKMSNKKFKENLHPSTRHLMDSPDTGFVDLLRFGIVSLQLLPENSMAGIVVITDGVISLPDATIFDSLLVQLRNLTISCSFLQFGPVYSPSAGFGYVAFNDLLHFLANATFGVHLTTLPPVNDDYLNEMNDYHKSFLTWGFQKALAANSKIGLLSESQSELILFEPEVSSIIQKEWSAPLMVSLPALLSCRLREGYTIKEVNISKDQIILILILRWKYSISLEYRIQCPWPLTECGVQTEVRSEVSYEFLEDVSSSNSNRGYHSLYRQRMISKYRSTVQILKETDQRLTDLQSFHASSVNLTIPECVKRGYPVFYLDTRNGTLIPSSDSPFPQFSNFWKMVCMLNVTMWQKWMHIHRIGVILEHDSPLPKNLHIANSSARYGIVQTREAEVCLMSFLSSWSDFTLLENHSYVKFLYSDACEENHPSSFFIVRITSKRPPCLTIHLAFLGGTSGCIRNKFVEDLRESIGNLHLREKSKERKASLTKAADRDSVEGTKRTFSESSIPCCSFSCKPIEKILMCYDRSPSNFYVCQTEDFTSGPSKSFYNKLAVPYKTTSNNQALLSRYLHHRRWLWNVQAPSAPPISSNFLTRILNTLIKMRLQEGFKFAYSSNGCLTLVKEIKMKLEIHDHVKGRKKHFDVGDKTSNCVIQYIVFPPCYSFSKGSSTEDNDEADSTESDGLPHIVTEVWVEPQNGVTTNTRSVASGLRYKQVANSFYEVDYECINHLVTFESLVQLHEHSEYEERLSSHQVTSEYTLQSTEPTTSSIQEIHQDINLMNLLSRCLQAELLVSTLIKDFSNIILNPNLVLPENNQANHIMYDIFLDHLSKLHNNKHFHLSHEDNLNFPSVLKKRPRSSSEPVLCSESKDKYRDIPKWRCFVKLVSQNHVILTLVPSSFYDLQLLFICKERISNTNSKSFYLMSPNDDIRRLEKLALAHTQEQDILDPVANTILMTSTKENKSPESLTNQYFTTNYSKEPISPSSHERRIRYKSGPAFASENYSYTDGPSMRERANSLQSKRPSTQSFYTAPVEDSSIKTRCRRRNISMPVKTHKEMNASYLRSIPFETMEDDSKGDLSLCSQKGDGTLSHKPSQMTLDDEQHTLPFWHIPILGSVTLPVYVYECKLPLIVTQIISRCSRESVLGCDFSSNSTFKNHDLRDYPFKMEENTTSYTSHEAADKFPSPESASEELDSMGSDSKFLRNFVNSVERCHRQAFVMGVFEALSRNIPIQGVDVQHALDQCQEIFLEADITDYMKAICGHLKDFSRRLTLEERKQELLTNVRFRESKDLNTKESVKEINKELESHSPDLYSRIPPHDCESGAISWSFPISLLRTHYPTQELTAIHNNINQRFMNILLSHFRPIPNLPDYYYYVISHQDEDMKFKPTSLRRTRSKKKSGASSFTEGSEDFREESVCDYEEEHFDDDEKDRSIEFRSDAGSFVHPRYLSQFSHLSGLEEEKEDSTISDLPSNAEFGLVPPLFIHFTCTIRMNHKTLATTSISSLPTCLGDIANCLDLDEIQLDKVSITLELLVMTLIGGAPISSRIRSYSSCDGRLLSRFSHCSVNTNFSESPKVSLSESTDNTDDALLSSLPSDQMKAIATTFEKMKWLIQDEIMTSKLQHIPITEETLESVCTHVEKSYNSSNCLKDVVPLTFVLGKEQSMNEFMEEFKKLNLSNYQLDTKGSLYYLILKNFQKKRNFSSLVPPLSLSSIVVARSQSHVLPLESSTACASICSPDPSKSPRRLLHKVSFEADFHELAPKEDDFEKEKWIKRRQRKERRDSEKRGSVNSTDSESDTCPTSNKAWEMVERFQFKLMVEASQDSLGKKIVSGDQEDENALQDIVEDEKISADKKVNIHTGSSENLTTKAPLEPEIKPFEAIGNKHLELTRCESLNIPIHEETEFHNMRKSASTEGFGPVLPDLIPTNTGGDPSQFVDLSKEKLPDRDGLKCHGENHSKSRHSSGGDILKSRNNSGTGSLFGGHYSDISSLLESGQTTEDGCEGDISDSDEYSDWQQEFEYCCSSSPPNFWLIIQITNDEIKTYFHKRDDLTDEGKRTHNEVVTQLKGVVKFVNQKMLLRDLHERRECNQMLEPETPEDIWIQGDIKDIDDDSTEYLAADMKYQLGAFACKRVWSKVFELHPRISSSGKGGVKGIPAFLNALKNFAVTNRKNMFVYEDKTGIFYLRLHEKLSCGARNDCGVSRSSSVKSLGKKSFREDDITVIHQTTKELLPRVSSFSEKDIIVEGVPSTSTQRKKFDSIILSVHGIAEPGTEIKEDLVNMLKNKLDEAVLDAVCQMPWNNPHHKLTPEDVHFIQPPFQLPTNVFRYTVNIHALPCLQALCCYLKQNMLSSGFTIPKYTDASSYHFQDFSNCDQESSVEPTFFLYVTSQKKSVANAIACVSYSFVDSLGTPLQQFGSPEYFCREHGDFIQPSEFESLIHTSSYSPTSDKKPQALAILQFKVWAIGRLDMNQCLLQIIKNALWDLNMEFRFLCTPVCLSNSCEPNASHIEGYMTPGSPVKGNKLFFSKGNSGSKISVPDIPTSPGVAAKAIDIQNKSGIRSPIKLRHSFDLGKNQKMDQKSKNEESEHENKSQNENVPQNLHSLYSKSLQNWLDFGLQLNVPSVKKHTFRCPTRTSLYVFVSELQKWVSNYLIDPTLVFQQNSENSEDYSQIFSLKEFQSMCKDVTKKIPDLVLINYNRRISESPHLEAQENMKGVKKRMFPATYVNLSHLSEATLDACASLSSPPPHTIGSNQLSQFSMNFGTTSSDNVDMSRYVIPRQIIIFAKLQQQELTIYFYNWLKDLCDLLSQNFNRLCHWTSARYHLLSSLALQKLGLFHNEPFSRQKNFGTLSGSKKQTGTTKKEEDNPFHHPQYIKGLTKSVLPEREIIVASCRKNDHCAVRGLKIGYRDIYPPIIIKKTSLFPDEDQLRQYGLQMHSINREYNQRYKEKRGLNAIIDSCANSSNLPENSLGLFKRHARVAHVCFTPLLFLPRWRKEVARTRDCFTTVDSAEPSEAASNVPPIKSNARSRNTSGTNVKTNTNSSHLPLEGRYSSSSTSSKSKTTPEEEKWHDILCIRFLKEYIQYMECLGFKKVSLYCNQQSGTHAKPAAIDRNSKTHEVDISTSTYLVRCVVGGVILLQLCFSEPFFSAIVYAFESPRVHIIEIKHTISVPCAFLDDVEVLRVLLHMHSFTYDYHLRAVATYVAGRELFFPLGYHLSSFLADFIKYYNKGPNFARNHIHSGEICIDNTGTPGEHLYNYLLARAEKQYDMRVLRMTPILTDSSSDKQETEYVLVQSTINVNEYELTLLVTHDSILQDISQNSLYLKFYIILTSTRNVYPAYNFSSMDKKGCFRTVSMAHSSNTDKLSNSVKGINDNGGSSNGSETKGQPKSTLKIISEKFHSGHQTNIIQENVNYLGYFSNYEMVMQQAMQHEVEETERKMTQIFDTAKIHCRQDTLWKKLMAGTRDDDKGKFKEQVSSLTFNEFTELLNLVKVNLVSNLDSHLLPLVSKPIQWYQSLSRLLITKYQDCSKTLTSSDGNIHHIIVFNSACPDSCMLLTMNFHSQRGELCCVQKSYPDGEIIDAKTRALLEDIINCVCFHLWSTLL